MNLREDKGWTYGARSRYPTIICLDYSSSTSTWRHRRSLSEILRELRDSGVSVQSTEELDAARGYIPGQIQSLRKPIILTFSNDSDWSLQSTY